MRLGQLKGGETLGWIGVSSENDARLEGNYDSCNVMESENRPGLGLQPS